MDFEKIICASRRQELVTMCQQGSAPSAISTAIIETLQAVHDIEPEFRKMAILDRAMVIATRRHRELVALAAFEPEWAIDATIQDTAIAGLSQKPFAGNLSMEGLEELEAEVAAKKSARTS